MDTQQHAPGRAEQRRAPRVTFGTEAWIGQDGIFTHTDERFGNLSTSGAFLHLHDGYSLGSLLSLKFRIPGEEQFITCSAIVRTSPPGQGVGVEFWI